MGVNVKTSKAKGRRLQNYVRDTLRSMFSSRLEDDDIKSQTMGMTGEDVVLSPAAKKLIPYSFECKNKERLDLWASLEQAASNCEDRTPILVFKRNRTKTYVAFEYSKFLELIDEEK